MQRLAKEATMTTTPKQNTQTSTDIKNPMDSDSNKSQSNTEITKTREKQQKFYDFYLEEHQNMACRRLHFAGSSFGLLGLA